MNRKEAKAMFNRFNAVNRIWDVCMTIMMCSLAVITGTVAALLLATALGLVPLCQG